MSNNHPLVSIGVPVYNGSDYLAAALDSICGQSYTHLEIIISDNGSTDETESICRAYASQDSRIKYVRQETNQGATWNFNEVVRLASAPYFRWAAHDDVLAKTCIEKCVAELEARPDVVLCHTRVEVIDEDGRFKHDFDITLQTDHAAPATRFRELLIPWNMYYEIFGLIRRSALDKAGKMGNFSHADGILLERLALLGPFSQIDEVLFYPRFHARQSNQVYGLNYHSYTAWFDPKLKGQRVFPYWRQFKEHLAAVREGSLSITEKSRCYTAIATWLVKRRRELVKDLLVIR